MRAREEVTGRLSVLRIPNGAIRKRRAIGRRVVVTDVETRGGLGACRSLRDAGYAVAGVASTRLAAGHWSRSCSERFTVSDPRRDPASFVAGLAAIVSRGGYDVLVLGSDASLLAVSPRRSSVEAHVRIGLPPDEVVGRVLDKRTLIAAAAEVGLDVPETVVCSSVAQALEAARSIGFPVVLKPLRSVSWEGGKGRERASRRVADVAALERVAPEQGLPVLVQRGAEGELYSVAGVIAAGRLRATVVSRYRRTWPVDSGSASFSETVAPPPALVESVEALLSALGWQGIFEVELIRGADGSFAAIDVNPRLYGSITLSAAARAPLPAIWCEWLLGRDPAPVTARAGVYYRWEDADLRHGLRLVREGRVGAGLSVMRPYRRVTHAYARLRDPGPLMARIVQVACKLLHLGSSEAGSRESRRTGDA